MDLVSSTLDKYLKHRFDGNGLDKRTGVISTETTESEIPVIYNISIAQLRPCCVTLREDQRFLGAGFENSHIYLWKVEQEQNNDQLFLIGAPTPLLAHSGPVYDIKFLNNNKDLMLSCSEDTTIRLWCLNTKCNVFIYRGHNYPIWSIDMGPRGRVFASASMDSTARLWQLDHVTPSRIFCGHCDDVECVRFHPNEKYIATGSTDTTVRLWNVSDGKMVRLMVGHKAPIVSLSFLPNGKFLASASRDGTIKVWNLADNSCAAELLVPRAMTISFSLERNLASTCCSDNILRLWRIDDAKLVEIKSTCFKGTAQKSPIQSQFHRNNKLFVIQYDSDDNSSSNKVNQQH